MPTMKTCKHATTASAAYWRSRAQTREDAGKILARLVKPAVLLLLCAASTLAFAAKPTAVLRSPIRLALNSEGLVAVSEFAQQKVLLLDARTHSVRGEIEVDGKPLGVAWGEEVLYVGNDTSGRVGSNRSGKWALLGTLGDDDQPVPGPSDIAFDPLSGRIFVLSSGLKTVLVFSAEGNLLSSVGGIADTVDCLRNPTALAVNGIAGELFVSDYGDPDFDEPPGVKIYAYDGSYLGAICGDSGQSGYEFSRPQGVAATEAGQILLADSLLGRVLVFDRISLLGVSTLGQYGTQPGELRLPLDVVVDADGEMVLVTNNRSGRIESFELEEEVQ
jgi:DNA-binding beta-propeller fold protein YncE